MIGEPTVDDLMRSMVSGTIAEKWPKCTGCDNDLKMGESGFVCPDCQLGILSFGASPMAHFQYNYGCLRRWFPERCT